MAHSDAPGAVSPWACRYLLTKAPLLLEEMLKIAMLPRTQAGTGWMVSAATMTTASS
jgi:hypothetical protein